MNVLEFKNVTKSYQDGNNEIEALKETNFKIEEGQFIAIIGPSGSGKSTFLTLAGGLQTPSKGQIIINGKDYTNLSEKERAKLRFNDIGFVLQASNLVPFLTAKQQLELVDRINKKKRQTLQDQKSLFKELGIDNIFVQDNISKSSKGVLRGLHFQKDEYAQAKLVYVLRGAVLDITVDLRKDSETFGKYVAVELNDKNKQMLFIPRGFAHGFLTLEEDTEFIYKCDNFYNPKSEVGIVWNDTDLNIDWNLEKYNIKEKELIISEKDKKNITFKEYRRGK